MIFPARDLIFFNLFLYFSLSHISAACRNLILLEINGIHDSNCGKVASIVSAHNVRVFTGIPQVFDWVIDGLSKLFDDGNNCNDFVPATIRF